MAEGGNEGYKILLMNTNGPSLGRGTAEKRQTAFKKLVDVLNPSIIFTQECNSKFLECLGRFEYAQLCHRGSADAGFIYNQDDFEHKVFTQHKVITDILGDLRNSIKTENHPIDPDFDFIGRAQVSEFKCKPCLKPAFLAISWHGVYKCSDKMKIKYMKNFFTVVEEIHRERQLPVIIGGDFNLDKELWPKLPEVFRIHDYTLSTRRRLGKKALIDLFVSTDGLSLTNTESYDLYRIKYLKPQGTDTEIRTWLKPGDPDLTEITILNPKDFDLTKIKFQNPEGFDLTKLKILKPKGLKFTSTNIQNEYPEGVANYFTEIKIRNPDRFDLTNIKIKNPEGFDFTKLEILGLNLFNLSTIEVLNPQGYDLMTKISNATDFFDHDPVQAYLTPQPDIEAITEGLAAASLESPTRVEPAEVPPPLAEAATTTTPPDIEVPAERLQAVRSPNEGRLSSTHAEPSPLAPRQHQPDRMFEGRTESTTAGTPVDATETSTENLMTIPRNGESSRTSAAVNAASSDEENQEYDSDSPVEQTVVNV